MSKCTYGGVYQFVISLSLAYRKLRFLKTHERTGQIWGDKLGYNNNRCQKKS